MIPNVLTIAGSDPCGGAGIQADLKTYSALGVYGMSAVIALTAQNTLGVRGVHVIEPDFVAAQIDAIYADVRVDAVKIGMVATADIAMVIADRLRHHGARNVVLDPVMVAKSGDRLLQEDAVAAVRDHLAPLARVITPNLPEAAVLIAEPAPATLAEMHQGGAQVASVRVAVCTAEGRPSERRSEYRSAVRRQGDHRACQRAHRDAQYAWHWMHTRRRHRGAVAALRRDRGRAAVKAYLTSALAASHRLTGVPGVDRCIISMRCGRRTTRHDQIFGRCLAAHGATAPGDSRFALQYPAGGRVT